MNAVPPIAIIVFLGALSGFVLRRLKWNIMLRAGAAAVLATVVWVCGCMLVLLGTGEEWPLLLRPILLTFLTALPPALLISLLIRTRKPPVRRETIY